MKNIIKTTALLFTFSILLFQFHFASAQVPQTINYQAIARNSSGTIMANQSVSVEIRILQGSSTGTQVCDETFATSTNDFGLINLQIGSQNPTAFDTINWAAGSYWIEVSLDGTLFGTSQLVSVPYALHAATADSLINFSETDPQVGTNSTGFVPIWDGNALVSGSIFEDVSLKIGIGTTTPAYRLDIDGDMRIFNFNDEPTLFFSRSNSDIPGSSYYSAAIKAPIGSTARDIAFYTQYQGTFSEKMRITGNGLVGIGTTTPSTALDVNGVITATGGNSDEWNAKQNELTAGSGINISNDTVSTDLDFILPAGMIIPFAGDTNNIPNGWLLCDGSELDRTIYARLFATIDTIWGIGDGSTTFNLPDFRGTFMRGTNLGTGNDPDAASRTASNGGNSGDKVGSVQEDGFKSHNHSMEFHYSTSGVPNNYPTLSGYNSAVQNSIINGVSYRGGNETRPKNKNVHYLIKY
ncbi:MAG: tail fiber protein [Bacteroidales bacterium]|nr:tail fiber protein [Bacteroidales bacterium]